MSWHAVSCTADSSSPALVPFILSGLFIDFVGVYWIGLRGERSVSVSEKPTTVQETPPLEENERMWPKRSRVFCDDRFDSRVPYAIERMCEYICVLLTI